MSTVKTRINISVGKNTRDLLRALAKREQVPVATKAVRLLEEALELEEDRRLTVLADRRLKEGGRSIPDSDAVWK
jgi:predicted DNA-binding protein